MKTDMYAQMISFRTLQSSELCETYAVIGQEHIRVQSQMIENHELCQTPSRGLKTIFIQTGNVQWEIV